MADMFDYLDWRGDVPLSASPFNEVDNLILAYLSYPDYRGVLPDSGEEMALEDVREAFFQRNSREDLLSDGTYVSKAALMLDRLASGERFGSMKFCSFICERDPDVTKQISAVTLLLDDGTAYVSFRGTDSSLTGWKEDCNLSFLPETEGQKRAVSYLDQVASRFSCPLRVGGHSKGANFAMYASALCSAQDRILSVYSNDGPGFREEFVRSEAYLRILPRIRSYVPDTSVIGLLLSSSVKHHVVKSSAVGIWQHDAFSWEILRNHFVEAEFSAPAKFIDRTLDNWISEMDDETRRFFTDTLFAFFESTGKETFREIRDDKVKSAEAMLDFLGTLPKEKYEEMMHISGLLLRSGGQTARTLLSGLLFGEEQKNTDTNI